MSSEGFDIASLAKASSKTRSISMGSSSKISSFGASFVKKLSTCKDSVPLKKSSIFISSLVDLEEESIESLSIKAERSISPSEKSSRETSSVFDGSALSFSFSLSSIKAERSISPSENVSKDTSSGAVSNIS